MMMSGDVILAAAGELPKLHLVVAWAWVMAGFISGTLLGLNFHREDWLGGYGSHKRRLYRLAHISFFGLALINLAFSVTTESVVASGLSSLASVALIIGTATMPICCMVVAHRVAWRGLFSIPVTSLITGSICTFLEVIKL